jgi:hypothetical protein
MLGKRCDHRPYLAEAKQKVEGGVENSTVYLLPLVSFEVAFLKPWLFESLYMMLLLGERLGLFVLFDTLLKFGQQDMPVYSHSLAITELNALYDHIIYKRVSI